MKPVEERPELFAMLAKVRANDPNGYACLTRGRAFSGILGELAEIGYNAIWECVPAAALGAGHRRERVWLLASDANGEGLEGYTGDGAHGWQSGPHRPTPPPYLLNRECRERGWYHQSQIEPLVNGLSRRVAKDQLTAIGNSLVPHVAYVFFSAIAAIYEKEVAA